MFENLFSPHHHSVLFASAGTGKTYNLTQRYLHILEHLLSQQKNTSHLLVLTFTEKAALEMRNRIRDEIRHQQEHLFPHIFRHQKSLLDSLEYAPIGTFHSFCANILRQYPKQACLDPEFQIIDEDETNLLLDRLLHSFLLNPPQSIKEALDYLLNFFSGKALQSNFMQMIKQRSFLCFGNEEQPSWIHQALQENLIPIIPPQIEKSFLDFYHEHQDTIHDVIQILLSTHPLDLRQDVSGVFPWHLEQAAQQPLVLISLLHTIFAANVKNKLKSHPTLKHFFYDIFKKEILENPSLEETLAFLPSSLDEINIVEIRKSYALVFQALLIQYEQQLQHQNKMDFAGLETTLLKLLDENAQVQEAIGNTYPFIQIDEFQDTNIIQWEIIRKIARWNLEQRHFHSNIFIVGDTKQSIYRFRGGDVTVFQQARNELLADAGQEKSLQDCYRSTQPMIQLFNHLFHNRIMTDQPVSDQPYLSVYDTPVTQPQKHKFAHWNFDPWSLSECFVANTENPLSARQQAEKIAQKIQALQNDPHFQATIAAYQQDKINHGETPPATFAILLQKRKNIIIFESVLTQHGLGPIYSDRNPNIFSWQPIRDVFHLIQVLHNPHDDLSLFGVLHSLFFRIPLQTIHELMQTHQESQSLWQTLQTSSSLASIYQILDQLRREMLTEPMDTLIWKFIETSQVEAFWLPLYSLEEIHNALLLLFKKYQELAPQQFHEWQQVAEAFQKEWLQLRLEKPAPQSLIRILTVHGAKGLEFPVVFIPELESIPPANLSGFALERIHGQYEIGLRAEQDGTPIQSSYLHFLNNMEKRHNEEERKRLFYVACTRAIFGCYFMLGKTGKTNNPRKNCWAGILLDAKKKNEWLEKFAGVEIHEDMVDTWVPIVQNESEQHSFPRFSSPSQGNQVSLQKWEDVVWQARSHYSVSVHQLLQPKIAHSLFSSSIQGAVYGDLFHYMMEHFQPKEPDWQALQQYAKSQHKLDTLDAYQTLFETDWTTFIESDLYRQLTSTNIICQEVPLHHPFTFADTQITISGQIDLLFQDSRGWHLIDYKTERIPAEEAEAYFHKMDYFKQLAIYRELCWQCFHITVADAHVYSAFSGLLWECKTDFDPNELLEYIGNLNEENNV